MINFLKKNYLDFKRTVTHDCVWDLLLEIINNKHMIKNIN